MEYLVNKSVDIKFSVHDMFLELLIRCAQYLNIGKSINFKVFGNNKPKGLSIIKSEISDSLKMLPASIQCDIFATKEDINLLWAYVVCMWHAYKRGNQILGVANLAIKLPKKCFLSH